MIPDPTAAILDRSRLRSRSGPVPRDPCSGPGPGRGPKLPQRPWAEAAFRSRSGPVPRDPGPAPVPVAARTWPPRSRPL